MPGPWSTGGAQRRRLRRESPARNTGSELRSGDGKALKPQQGSAASGVLDQSPGPRWMWQLGRARRVDDGRQARVRCPQADDFVLVQVGL